MGAGVAGALKRVGGEKIEEEAVRKGPIAVGEAVETTAGRLQATYVIHAAVMGQDLRTNERHIKEATHNTLRLANSLGIQSIAFPALGTGVGGFPPSRCAHIMLKEVMTYPHELTVFFVLYSEECYVVFMDAYTQLTK